MIKVFGILLRFHPLFVIVMLASVATGYFVELLTLFGIVFIHELGHIAAARSIGWRVKEIELLPFGGVAVMDTAGGDRAWEEVWVALAGPLQNAAMIGLALLCRRFGLWDDEWGRYFMTANAMIALFNLIPVLPLDGGRILQSLVSLAMPYYRTLSFCGWISLLGSAGMTAAAFHPVASAGIQLNVLAVGLYLLAINWVNRKNRPYYFLRFLMNREPHIEALLERGTAAETLLVRPWASVSRTARLIRRGNVHVFHVISESGSVSGVLSEQQLLRGMFRENKMEHLIGDLIR